MANEKTHAVTGLLLGAATNVFCQYLAQKDNPEREIDWGEVFVGGLAGLMAGLSPDMLEPATGPDHRGCFHSIAAGALVFYASAGEHNQAFTPELRRVLYAASFGYLSHLALDSQTPAGIRLI